MKRRNFLKMVAQISFGMGVSRIFPGFSKPLYGQVPDKDYDLSVISGEPEKAVSTAIELIGGIKKFVKPGNTVVLKPNMGFPNPAVMASTTNPQVIRAVAQLCVDAGAKRILILDHPLRRPEVCLKRNGIKDAVKGIKNVFVFVVTDKQFFEKVDVPKGKELHQVEVLKDVLTSDVVINLPIAKSHNATGVTMGLKGLMGIIYDREYFHEKVDLNQAIADLNTVVKSDLTIIDATRVMTSGGPTGPGTVEKLNTVIASADPVAADAAVVSLTKWYGQSFEAKQVKHIKLAHEMGLGEMNLEKLKIKKMNLHG